MSQIQSEIQKLDPSAIISLFTLDTSSVGGPMLTFVQGSESETAITFGGTIFYPIDIIFEGLETSGVGALPTPTLRIANTDGLIQSIVNTYGDLNGCTLYRVRTFSRFLDGRAEADPAAVFGPDVYRIEQKSSDTPIEIVWDLSAAIDQEGKLLPGRFAVRDTCLWRYRQRNAADTDFDYSKAQCPYTGTSYFNEKDEPTTAALDKPSRSLNCCRLRFGEGKPWPFGGFPGMDRN